MALRKHLGEMVVAHTQDGRSLQGILVGVHRDVRVLAHASLLTDGGPVALGGEVHVPVENVSFFQFGVEAVSE